MYINFSEYPALFFKIQCLALLFCRDTKHSAATNSENLTYLSNINKIFILPFCPHRATKTINKFNHTN